VWILIGTRFQPRPVDAEDVSIPVDGAQQANIRMNYGAGRVNVYAGAESGMLVEGRFGGGLDYNSNRSGDRLDVSMRIRDRGFPHVITPWTWGQGGRFDWEVGLNPDIPLTLKLNTGASDTRLDLTDLQVTELRIDTGASATEITTPANVAYTKVIVKSGVASVKLSVPDGVAARIRVTGGLMSASVNKDRFPRVGKYYQSPDYETASRRVEMNLESGVGSISVG
ncbi:MAG: hypothetical protein ABIG63_08970, partial [Chloroflexota bacterium]